MSDSSEPTPRAAFAAAAAGFRELVAAVPAPMWGAPGLGSWSVRDLVGHGSRALATIEAYLGGEADGEPLEAPVEYFLALGGGAVGSEGRTRRDQAIAKRGREAGVALGQDPAAAVAELAGRVGGLVDAAPDAALVATPAGPMTLIAYLPTRTFELAIHSLDLARALSLEPPQRLAPAVAASLVLAGRLAAADPRGAEVLEALGGRRGLPAGFSVV